MTNNAKIIANEIDEVTEGFRRVPVVERPPKIKWGKRFKAWTLKKQNDYLKRFAESMNHAAAKVQDERDALGQMLEKKEQQIIQLKAALDANNQMLQSEINKMNEYRQQAVEHSAAQRAEIQELKNGHTG